MLVVKKDTVLLCSAGRLTEGMPLTEDILKKHPELKQNGQDEKQHKEDRAKEAAEAAKKGGK